MFETHAANDLIHAVDCRIGPKAVEFFAKRAAAASGDARKLLDLIARAVSKCKEQLPRCRLESSEAVIVVMMPDAMTALRESVDPKCATLIQGLPLTRRAVLRVVVRLARSRRKESNQLTLGKLRRHCVGAFAEDAELDADGFKDGIEALSHAGLSFLATPDAQRFLVELAPGSSVAPTQLKLQPEGVESAAESELLDAGFHHWLVGSLPRACLWFSDSRLLRRALTSCACRRCDEICCELPLPSPAAFSEAQRSWKNDS